MFNDDEDYGFLTGGLGDLDGDGRVDFVEYMNEEDDFQRIMGGNDDDDYSVLDDDEDIEMLTQAEELGIDPNDYIDNDELKQALEDYQQIIDSVDEYTVLFNNLQNEYNDEEYSDFDDDTDEDESDDTVYLPDGFDISKLSLTIGAETTLNYDGKPIDQVFGVSEENENNSAPKNTPEKQQSTQSIERRYYDREDRKYRIGDAIYDNFKEVSDNYEKHECEDFSSIIEKVYSVNNELGLKIWMWVLNNFKGALVNQGVDEYDSQAWTLTDCIFGNLHSIDNENNSDFIFEYASKHPELEEIIYHLSYIDDFNHTITNYIPYCIENDFRDNFVRVYNGFITNKFRNEKKLSKYSILEDLLSFCQINGLQEADGWYYSFFEKEINSLDKPLKRDYLIKLLNAENYGKRMFLKPNVDDVIEVSHEEPITKKCVETEFENKESLENTLEELKISLKNITEEVKVINFKIKEIEAKINNI